MTQRPILFTAAMVRALLDGSKTQTRRPYKTRKHPDFGCEMAAFELAGSPQHVVERMCPHGQPGDRLWVRETWAQPAALDPGPTVYRADYPACVPHGYTNVPPADEITWKPSIHMPRAASRILLEILSVRVERLQEIGVEDIEAEGVVTSDADIMQHGCRACVLDWIRLWESTGGSWDANPWVWVVEFKRVTP